jgi:transcriptional regulator with XRE-family HTH domain
LGEHIRKRRLDLGLLQKDIASMISVDKETVFRWESNESLPSVLLLPAIIRFLGHDPLPTPKTFSEQLRHSRRYLGLSQTATARLLGIDPTTLRKWEQGRLEPIDATILPIARKS